MFSGFTRSLQFKSAGLLVIISLAGCGPEALPREQPEAMYGQAMQRAERASREAGRAALEAKRERERAAELLAEARSLTTRLENAERRCAEQVSRISQAEDSRRRDAKRRVEQAKHEKEIIDAVPTPVPTPVRPVDPEYSPSDAPLETGGNSSKPAPAAPAAGKAVSGDGAKAPEGAKPAESGKPGAERSAEHASEHSSEHGADHGGEHR